MNYNLHCNSNRVPGMWHVEDVGDVILIFFECNTIYVEDVEDRSNTPKGCNAMYVKDGKRTYIHILARNFLNIQWIFNPKKVLESWDLGLSKYTIKSYVCWTYRRCRRLSLTSSTCFNIHSIWWYGWKALSLSFPKLFSDWKSIKY